MVFDFKSSACFGVAIDERARFAALAVAGVGTVRVAAGLRMFAVVRLGVDQDVTQVIDRL